MKNSPRTRRALAFTFAFALAFLYAAPSRAASANSQLIVRELRSENIAHNKVGADPLRKILVYLPAGYDASSTQRYPVIYFLPNPFEESYRYDFDHRDAQSLFDRAIAEGVIRKFILVAVDMNTPLGSSWYVNSSATGNWEDFMIHTGGWMPVSVWEWLRKERHQTIEGMTFPSSLLPPS